MFWVAKSLALFPRKYLGKPLAAMGCSPTRLRPPKSRSSARCRLLGADQEPCFRYPIRRRRCVPRGTASGCARRCGAPASFWLGGLVAVGDGVTPVPQPPRLVVQARPLGSRAAPERDPGGPFSADSSFHSRPAPPLRFRTFATPAAARACAEGTALVRTISGLDEFELIGLPRRAAMTPRSKPPARIRAKKRATLSDHPTAIAGS